MKHKILIDKFNEGASNEELALIFDSTPKAISVLLTRLRRKGLVGYRNRRWNQDEYDTLIELKNSNTTNKEIANILGRTEDSVKQQVSALIKEGTLIKGYCTQPWNQAEYDTLIELKNSNTPNKEIANILGRTEDSVKYKIGVLIKEGKLIRGNYWEVGLSNIRKHGGCHDKTKPTILYLVQFENFYKIGITQKSIKERLYGAPKYTIVDYVSTDLDFAFETEAIIKKSVNTFIPDIKWFERNGKTECFISDTPITSLEQLL